MNKLNRLAAICLLGISASACTVKVDDRPNELPETVTPTTPYLSDSDIFLSNIYGEYPELEYQYGDAWLLELGSLICQAIDEGMTFYDLSLMVVQTGADPGHIGWIAGAAIISFCPENEWFINSAGA